ncbi:poly(hydroxyalkanoate) depolymerase family esterase [Alkalihalobacillus xiaoxiensis]|uniref:Poly(Hydroxyalkanoate) depolymerase family esterase n=1 Tax=Shouchella xiaoxiensis TaxID=766895 RepID=A0ABS2SN03_9BACI|nr:PHB depolymerase family esterase [Shouchella xiaoxiensis]MBM7836899.1 poly(hydroxyalkanoate) depolymerase family esterase [Shouchella xiaoxiensis]
MARVLASMMMLLVLLFIPQIAEAGTTESGSFGGKSYKLYTPDSIVNEQNKPLVVMLHGCTQDATQFAAGTQMNAVADREGFRVLYPEQSSSADIQRCWKWFESAHQARGRGEPAVLAGLVEQVISQKAVNRDQVYVGGLSAGGAMAGVMGATYPDLFKGIGIASGLEYKAGTTQLEALTAMQSGGPDPARQGRLAFEAMGSYAQVVPTIVFHGTADYTVNVINGNQALSQWAKTNDLVLGGKGVITDRASERFDRQVPGGRAYTEKVYTNQETNKEVLRKILVTGMGHAWSGGSTQGTYTDPNGPNASEMMWAFFSQDEGTPEPEPDAPTVTANPAGGSFVDRVTVALTSTHSADIRCTIDGSQPTSASPLYSTPFTFDQTTTLKCIGISSEGIEGTVMTEVYQVRSGEGGEEQSIELDRTHSGFIGRLAADGIGGDLKVGDKGMYNTDTYRTIVSFSVADITASNSSSTAILRLPVASQQGTISALVVDAAPGYFGSSLQLERNDFNARAALPAINRATFSANTSYVEFTLSAAALEAIKQESTIQFRIQATTTAGFPANLVQFTGGGPTLILK